MKSFSHCWMMAVLLTGICAAVLLGCSGKREVTGQAEAIRARMASGGDFQAEAGEQLVLGLAVRWIPAGRFTMGSPSYEEGRYPDEIQHEVVLSQGFFMAETECTQGQWEMVMGSNPSRFKGPFKGPNRPVESLRWDDAVKYCRKLTAKQRAEGILPSGWEWRLPTEAEWEYAARAGTTGARHGELDKIAWWGGNSGSETHAVGDKQANAWGLHDMMGNVWEWCSDNFRDYPRGGVNPMASDGLWPDRDPRGQYPSGSVTNPGSMTNPMNGYNPDAVLRGGSWSFGAEYARSAFRSRYVPDDRNLVVPGSRSLDLGFRPALSSVR